MLDIYSKLKSLEKLIGNTPLVEITCIYNDKEIKIYSKLEYYNYTGSIKDRMALHIIKKSYENKELTPNDTIIEATSGNTGISFSSIGTYLGHKVVIYMPDWMSDERKKLLRGFGAEINLVYKEDGGFLKCIYITEEIAKNNKNVFLPKQFSNKYNTEAHYCSTGPEILNTLKKHNLTPSAFIAGVGTGGTVMGIGTYLKKHNYNIKIYPLEPSNSPTLSTGTHVNEHRIQGIVDEFIPPILDFSKVNDVIAVDDGDAILMAQKLSKTLGLGVGISSGANFLGAIKAYELSEKKNPVIVTVFADDNKKYLSTDLCNIEPVKDCYISKNVELINLKTL